MTLDLANSGTTLAAFQIDGLGQLLPAARAPRDPPRIPASSDAEPKSLASLPARLSAPSLDGGNAIAAYPTGLGHARRRVQPGRGDFWLSNNLILGGDDKDHRYLTDGTPTGDVIDDKDWVAEFAADGAYNPLDQRMLWRVNVGGDTDLRARSRGEGRDELDPPELQCPWERGLAYDVASDTYYAGSWNDGVIQALRCGAGADPGLRLRRGADLGSGLQLRQRPALRPRQSHRAPGVRRLRFDTHNHYAVLGAFFLTSGRLPVLASSGGAGMEIDCDGHLCGLDQVTQTIYEAETEETDVCAFKEIPWLGEPIRGRGRRARSPDHLHVRTMGSTPACAMGS